MTTGQGVFTYQVEDVRREGDPQPPALEADQSRLLLVTTDAGHPGRAVSTVYVDAMLDQPGGRHRRREALLVVPRYENEMASDPTAYLALVALAARADRDRRLRRLGADPLGQSQTWVIGAPLILVALWGASDNAAMLLPNLM